MNEFLEKEEAILKMLKTVYDPEIPVNIYDLGLIYRIDISDDGVCSIDMTLTAPSCPASDFLMEDIRQKVGTVDGIKQVDEVVVGYLLLNRESRLIEPPQFLIIGIAAIDLYRP